MFQIDSSEKMLEITLKFTTHNGLGNDWIQPQISGALFILNRNLRVSIFLIPVLLSRYILCHAYLYCTSEYGRKCTHTQPSFIRVHTNIPFSQV